MRYPTHSHVFVRYFDDAWPVVEDREEVKSICEAAPTSETWIKLTGSGESHYLIDVRAGDVIAVESEPIDGDDEAAFHGEFPHS